MCYSIGMITYDEVRQRAEGFRSLTGLSVEEFEELAQELGEEYDRAEEERLARPDRRRRRGAGRKFRLDLRGRLLLFLTWLRVYPSYRVMGLLFDFDKSSICRNLKAMARLVQRVTRRALPDVSKDLGSDDLEALQRAFPGMRAIVDATEQRIRRPKGDTAQKAHYSGKKKAHTRKTQIVVNREGRIQHVSASVPGSMNDLTLERQSGVDGKLPDQVVLQGDGGFQGVQKDNPRRGVLLPHRKPRGGKLSRRGKRHNRRLGQVRVVVEHTFAHMKIFQVMYQVYRHLRDSYTSTVEIVAGLVNRHRDRRKAAMARAQLACAL